MNLKNLLDEVRTRGEKLKDEILNEIVTSKALHQIVSNKNFVSAVSRVIETKDEVKRTIRNQVSNICNAMDIPSKNAFSKIGEKLSQMEKSIEKLGAKNIPVRSLQKNKTASPVQKSSSRKVKPSTSSPKNKKKTSRKS